MMENVVVPVQPSAESLDRAMQRLLAEHPDAAFTAVDFDGSFIALPDSIPAGGHTLLAGRTALDLVEPADRVVVVEAWTRTREQGSGRAAVRLLNGGRAVLHLLDVRQIHGVYACVAIPQADADDGADIVDFANSPYLPPRFGRMRRDAGARPIDVDESLLAMLGQPVEAMIGVAPLDLLHPDDRGRGIENWMAVLASPGVAQRWRGRYRHGDGSWIWLELTNYNRLTDPMHGDVLSEIVDVTEEMVVHEALRAREQLLHRLAESLPLGLLQVDQERRVIYANSRLAELLGTPTAATIDEQLDHVSDGDRRSLAIAVDAVLLGGGEDQLDVGFDRPDGRSVICHLTMRGLVDDGGSVTGAIISLLDITESTAMRRELEHRATYDALTGCLNRSSIMAELALTMTDEHESTAVLFIDLDRFKQVNDRSGHGVGDALLTLVSGRIRAMSRQGDLVGRIGGDEFLVVCPRVPDAATAMAIAARVAAEIALPATVAGVALRVSGSVGVCWTRNATADPDEVVTTADTAMYDAKASRAGDPVLRFLSEVPSEARS